MRTDVSNRKASRTRRSSRSPRTVARDNALKGGTEGGVVSGAETSKMRPTPAKHRAWQEWERNAANTRSRVAGDSLWGGENGVGGSWGWQGLSPLVDVIRGLGMETEGVRAVAPRVLGVEELTAMTRDGICRRLTTCKVLAALAPGHTIDFAGSGLDPDVAQELINRATRVFVRVDGKGQVQRVGCLAQTYGLAMVTATWAGDAGVTDLDRPYAEVASGPVRWVSGWDRRDYQITTVAPSTSPHYRQSAWLRLAPYQPALEYNRQYSGIARGAEVGMVSVHPSRYVQLATPTGFSILQECVMYIANLLLAAGGGAALLQRASAGIFKIEDWDTQLMAGGAGARDKLQAQFDALSTVNTMILGKGEEFEWANLSTAGIEQGVYAIAYLLSAASEIPMDELLGTSPGGFASGEEQTKQWHRVLDGIREWLEPALRFVWDACIAEVTGGVVPPYTFVWKPYEVPSPGETIAAKSAALALGLQAKDRGLLSLDAVLAGLAPSGALDFDFAAAFKQGRPSDSNTVVESVEVGKFTAVLSAMVEYYAPNKPPPEAMQALINSSIKPLAGVSRTLFGEIAAPPPPPLDVPSAQAIAQATGTGGVTSSSAAPPTTPDALTDAGTSGLGAVVGGAVTGGLPGSPLTPEQIESEPWTDASAGEHFGFSSASLTSMRTEIPGVVPGPGQIAWLQHPKSGRVRYRRSDLIRALTGGRIRPEPDATSTPEASPLPPDNAATDAVPVLSSGTLPVPPEGVQWRMVRTSDETGVSGTGVVVRGLALWDGSIVSWWCVEGMPPRPHMDAQWADFYDVHIALHPSNGTRVQRCIAGEWYDIDCEQGPLQGYTT